MGVMMTGVQTTMPVMMAFVCVAAMIMQIGRLMGVGVTRVVSHIRSVLGPRTNRNLDGVTASPFPG